MELERFSGELTQMDMQDGIIHRLHLQSRDGRRLLITIDQPEEDMGPIDPAYSGTYALLAHRTRPQVSIAEDFS